METGTRRSNTVLAPSHAQASGAGKQHTKTTSTCSKGDGKVWFGTVVTSQSQHTGTRAPWQFRPKANHSVTIVLWLFFCEWPVAGSLVGWLVICCFRWQRGGQRNQRRKRTITCAERNPHGWFLDDDTTGCPCWWPFDVSRWKVGNIAPAAKSCGHSQRDRTIKPLWGRSSNL